MEWLRVRNPTDSFPIRRPVRRFTIVIMDST